MAPLDLSFYEEYLGYATWFYRSLPQPYPAMQCIWPDKAGLFPYEAGYDSRFSTLQRLLSIVPHYEEADAHLRDIQQIMGNQQN